MSDKRIHPEKTMPKTEVLQIRFSPEDMARIAKTAERDVRPTSDWARMILLKAVDEAIQRDLEAMPYPDAAAE